MEEFVFEEGRLAHARSEFWKGLRVYKDVVPSTEGTRCEPLPKPIYYPYILSPLLFTPIFGEFLENLYDSSSISIYENDIKAAKQFYDISLSQEEVSGMTPIIRSALTTVTGFQFAAKARKTVTGRPTTYATMMVANFMAANVEVKRTTETGFVLRQNIMYYVGYYANLYNSMKPPSDVLPALLINIHGAQVSVYGIVICLDQVNVIDLVTVEMLGAGSRNFNQQCKLFAALRIACAALAKHYEKLKQTPVLNTNFKPTTTQPEIAIPLVYSMNPYKRDFIYKNTQCELYYKSNLTRLVFLARVTENAHSELKNKEVIVKFASSYSREVHEFYQQRNAAPELYYCDNLANYNNGYIMVVMEYIEGSTLDVEMTYKELDKYNKILTEVVTDAVSNNLVHGDLRSPNIMIVDNHPKVLDFDWAGRKGEVKYPLNMTVVANEWAPDAKPYTLIKAEHDIYLINKIFKDIRTTKKIIDETMTEIST